MKWYVKDKRLWAVLSPVRFNHETNHMPRLLITKGKRVEAFYNHIAYLGRGKKVGEYETVAEAVRQAPYDLLTGSIETTSRAAAFLLDTLVEPDVFIKKE